jgi:hypothetical protein
MEKYRLSYVNKLVHIIQSIATAAKKGLGSTTRLVSITRIQPSFLCGDRVRRSLSHSLFGLLAVLVFLWGTAYKLSLYRPPDNRVPAKLCTRSSDAAKNAVDDAANGGETHPETLLLTLTPVLVAPLPLLLGRDRQDSLTKNSSPFHWTPDLFLRPPPEQVREIE